MVKLRKPQPPSHDPSAPVREMSMDFGYFGAIPEDVWSTIQEVVPSLLPHKVEIKELLLVNWRVGIRVETVIEDSFPFRSFVEEVLSYCWALNKQQEPPSVPAPRWCELCRWGGWPEGECPQCFPHADDCECGDWCRDPDLDEDSDASDDQPNDIGEETGVAPPPGPDRDEHLAKVIQLRRRLESSAGRPSSA